MSVAIVMLISCGKANRDESKPAMTTAETSKGSSVETVDAEMKEETMGSKVAQTTGKVSPLIRAAVAATSRPADDVERDINRKPAEVMAFFGVGSGMKVADLMTGRGYYADLLSRVVGPTGVVYAQNNEFVLKRFAQAPLSERLTNPELANVTRWDRELDALGFEPSSLDGALMVLFYHDTFWQNVDREAMNREIFAALKPGGFFGVIEHVASAGSGDVSKTLHRLDPVTLEKEITAVGFKLEARSQILRHPEDDHSVSVFDDSIRGKTDRVVLRFRK